MVYFVYLLKILALVNLIFLTNTSKYVITCSYLSYYAIISVLAVFLVGAFSNDIVAFLGLNESETYKKVAKPVDVFSRFSTSVASSFAYLVVKIGYLELNYLDSVRAKPGIEVVRRWSKEDYSAYLSLYADQMSIDLETIPTLGRLAIINKSNSMADVQTNLMDYLNAQAAKVVEALPPEQAPTSLLGQISVWMLQNPELALGAIIGTFIALAAIGYFVHLDGRMAKCEADVLFVCESLDPLDKKLDELEGDVKAIYGALGLLNGRLSELEKLESGVESLTGVEIGILRVFIQDTMPSLLVARDRDGERVIGGVFDDWGEEDK